MDAKRLQNVKLNQQSQLGHIGGRMVTDSEWLLYRPYKCDCDKKNVGRYYLHIKNWISVLSTSAAVTVDGMKQFYFENIFLHLQYCLKFESDPICHVQPPMFKHVCIQKIHCPTCSTCRWLGRIMEDHSALQLGKSSQLW